MSLAYIGIDPSLDTEGDDYPEPACLIHDTSGEDVRGWEMAECTCPPAERTPIPRCRCSHFQGWNTNAQDDGTTIGPACREAKK